MSTKKSSARLKTTNVDPKAFPVHPGVKRGPGRPRKTDVDKAVNSPRNKRKRAEYDAIAKPAKQPLTAARAGKNLARASKAAPTVLNPVPKSVKKLATAQTKKAASRVTETKKQPQEPVISAHMLNEAYSEVTALAKDLVNGMEALVEDLETYKKTTDQEIETLRNAIGKRQKKSIDGIIRQARRNRSWRRHLPDFINTKLDKR